MDTNKSSRLEKSFFWSYFLGSLFVLLFFAGFGSAVGAGVVSTNQSQNLTLQSDGGYVVFNRTVKSSFDLNSSGRVCDSTGCIVADTDTTYTAGTGLALDGTTFKYDFPLLAASNITSGELPDARVSDTLTVGSGGSVDSGALTILKDLVAGTGLNGGANDVFVGTDSDVTVNVDPTYFNGIYLNTTSCSATEVYVWGYGCINNESIGAGGTGTPYWITQGGYTTSNTSINDGNVSISGTLDASTILDSGDTWVDVEDNVNVTLKLKANEMEVVGTGGCLNKDVTYNCTGITYDTSLNPGGYKISNGEGNLTLDCVIYGDGTSSCASGGSSVWGTHNSYALLDASLTGINVSGTDLLIDNSGQSIKATGANLFFYRSANTN